jgi:hypothetical protein
MLARNGSQERITRLASVVNTPIARFGLVILFQASAPVRSSKEPQIATFCKGMRQVRDTLQMQGGFLVLGAGAGSPLRLLLAFSFSSDASIYRNVFHDVREVLREIHQILGADQGLSYSLLIALGDGSNIGNSSQD